MLQENNSDAACVYEIEETGIKSTTLSPNIITFLYYYLIPKFHYIAGQSSKVQERQ